MAKLSRSGVDKYLRCPRCFVLQYNHKIKPKSLPFSLNIDVDNICKNEFDYYREKKEPHPLFLEHGIDAIPYDHPEIDTWRNNFKGIRFVDLEKGYDFGGAIDDVWLKPDGELIISDVKATSKNIFDWDETFNKYDYAKGYKRQLEMYQWLFRKNGFKVAKEAYLVYYNGLRNEPFFNNQLKFELHLVRLDCDDSWVEEKIIEASNLLDSKEIPPSSSECEDCQYVKKRLDTESI